MMKMLNKTRLILTFVFFSVACGLLSCATPGSSSALPGGGFPKYYTEFEAHRYVSAREEVYLAANDRLNDVEARDYMLYNALAGSASLYAGDFRTAAFHFEQATSVIDSMIGQERGIVSTALWESAKYFKGEAYERMGLYFYRGLIYFMTEDYNNARAAFNKVLLVDQSAHEPEFQEDNAAAWYMLALTYQMLGQADNARIASSKALALYPDNACLTQSSIEQTNLIVLVETGEGPFKRRDRDNKALARLLSREGPATNADVYLNGQPVARTRLLVDYYMQAVTQGLKGRHDVQAAKGGIQNLMDNPALGFLLGHADLRSWRFLPHAMWMSCAHVAPGTYNMTLLFDEDGKELADYRETHYFVSVPEKGPRVVFLRNQPGQNNSKANQSQPAKNCVESSCGPDAQPFVLGGNDYSPPTPVNIARWQRAGHFQGETLMQVERHYRSKGYEWSPRELSCNCMCRATPHAALGGKCLDVPLQASTLNEQVHLGR